MSVNKQSQIIRYTETIERSFRLTTGEKDVSKVIRGLKDGTLNYSYDEDDRSKGVILNDGEAEVIAYTSEDYGLVMRRENFRTEVEWPSSGFLSWLWVNREDHTWWVKGFLAVGWLLLVAMMLWGKGYTVTRGAVLISAFALPLVLQLVVLTWIQIKKERLES